jgi:hypothetical protein
MATTWRCRLLRLLLRTNQNNEHSNGECDFAYVEIDAAVARKIRARQKVFLKAKEKDSDSHVMQFWDASCRYFKRDEDDVETFVHLLDLAWEDSFVEVEPGAVPGKYFEDRGRDSLEQGTDCDLLLINEHGFEWKCYPKYFDGVEISTESLPYELLKKLL